MKRIRCIKYVKRSYINGIHYFKHSGRIRVNFGNTEKNFWILREFLKNSYGKPSFFRFSK